MIFRRVKQVQNFRIFNSWSDDEQERPHRFGRRTVIFGTNGTGKSTLADVFHAIERAQSIDSAPEPYLDDIILELTDGTVCENKRASDEGVPPTFVFNKDYIYRNLQRAFDRGTHGVPLYVLGERDVNLESNIQNTEYALEQKNAQLASLEKIYSDASKGVTDVLNCVKGDVCELLQAYDPQTYNRTRFNVNRAADTLGMDGQQILTSEELEKRKDDLCRAGSDIPDLECVDDPTISVLCKKLIRLRDFDVTAVPLDRLANDERLANWAQKGLSLHEPGDRCGFCDQEVLESRMSRLRSHFDDSYKELQELIQEVYTEIEDAERRVIDSRHFVDSAYIKSEYVRKAADDVRSDLNGLWDSIERWSEIGRAVVHERESSPFSRSSLMLPEQPSYEPWKVLREAVEAENKERKNRRENISDIRKKSEYDILRHVAAKYQEMYAACREKKESVSGELSAAQRDKQDLERRLSELKGQRRDRRDGDSLARKLGADMAAYFGHKQLTVEFRRGDGGEDGFVFLRNGMEATNLSEGERNAIGLLYFLRSFESLDVEHDISSSTIVVDDPVSSFDQDFLLSAFTFLYNGLHAPNGEMICNQYVILTHSLDFFRVWKEQLEQARGKDREDARREGKKPSELMFERVTFIELGVNITLGEDGSVIRQPMIREFGQSLRARVSEYFYLFERVCESTRPGKEELAGLAGNAARRLLESFLRWKSPNTPNLMETAKKLGRQEEVREDVIQRIVKALHSASHRTELEIDRPQLSQDVVEEIRATLEFMSGVDEGHFQGMCEATGVKPVLRQGS